MINAGQESLWMASRLNSVKKKTKEKRDWCFPGQETLAKDIGVSSKTIARELKKEIAKNFIRREARYI